MGLLSESSRLIEGRLRRRSEGGAGSGVPRLQLASAVPEGTGTARRTLGPGREELAARASEEMPKPETRTRRPKITTAERREARVPTQGDAGRLASVPACRVMARQ